MLFTHVFVSPSFQRFINLLSLSSRLSPLRNCTPFISFEDEDDETGFDAFIPRSLYTNGVGSKSRVWNPSFPMQNTSAPLRCLRLRHSWKSRKKKNRHFLSSTDGNSFHFPSYYGLKRSQANAPFCFTFPFQNELYQSSP